jgi:hypothetical protein
VDSPIDSPGAGGTVAHRAPSFETLDDFTRTLLPIAEKMLY